MDFNKEIADKICELVADGSNLNKIAQMEGMPYRGAVYQWLESNPEFKNNYERAKECRADFRFDAMDAVMLDMRLGAIDASQARVLMDAIKWQCGKEKPKSYGDSITTKLADADGQKITTFTLCIDDDKAAKIQATATV